MKAQVIDHNGKNLSEITLKKEVFGVEPNKDILAQYVRVHLTNRRRGTSASKTRGEVSGSGAKPWAQKGLGRARVGTKRNPLWRTGGAAHGPIPQNWSLSMSKKMKKNALFSALSIKFSEGSVFILDKLSLKEPKTKDMQKILSKLELGSGTLVVIAKKDDNILKSISNIPDVSVVTVDALNTYQVLGARNLVFVKEAVKYLEDKHAVK